MPYKIFSTGIKICSTVLTDDAFTLKDEIIYDTD